MGFFTNLRDALSDLVPAWLYADDGGKVLHAIATLIDASVQLDRDRLEAGFPRRASPSANRLTGKDRGIPQGRTEDPAHYAERLIRWRYPRGHRARGSAWALLEQVSEYFGGLRTATIDVSGNQFVRDALGVETQSAGNTWEWDTHPELWARFWVTLYSTATGPFSEQRDLGDPLACTDGTLGLRGMTAQDAAAIRNLFARSPITVPWHPCGTSPQWAIVSFNGADVVPAGDYDRWSLPDGTDTQVALRDPAFRYFALATNANRYVERSTEFVAHVTLPDGTTYDGVAVPVWPNPIAMPDGTLRTDSLSPTFVTGVLLPDDASEAIGT